jgi:cytochrome c oxidase assembly protein subunit 15
VLKTRLARLPALLLGAQIALIITGGAVRLTKSGLGCPTWPECAKGSYLPSVHQSEPLINIWIEFANRMLTFVLVIIAIVTFGWVLKTGRKNLRLLAFLQILGILGQGVLGGITVLTKLNPTAVASHLLLSIALIYGAVVLNERSRSYPKAAPLTRPGILLVRLVFSLTLLVIIVGTVVTGTGPHAGDQAAPRYNFDIRMVTWLHADLVIALCGAILALYLLLKLAPITTSTQSREDHLKLMRTFIFLVLVQGSIGYLQYFTGVPAILVGLHLLGLSLVWLTACKLLIRTSKKRDSKIS